jgi:hypothetical protein
MMNEEWNIVVGLSWFRHGKCVEVGALKVTKIAFVAGMLRI